jgi:thioredoxin-related protein
MFYSVLRRISPYPVGLSVLLLTTLSIPTHASQIARIQWEISVNGNSIQESIEKATETGKPIMMYFYNDWCDTCNQLKTYTFRNQHIIDLATKFVCIEITPENIEDPLTIELQKQYNITSVPIILFLDPDGGIIEKFSGHLTPDQLAPIMKGVLKKEAEFQTSLAKTEKISDDPKLNKKIALTYLKRNQLEKATPFIIKMSDDPELNGHIALVYLEREKLEKALLFAEKVFTKDPENSTGLQPQLHLEFGYFYINQGYAPLMDPHRRSDEQSFQKAIEHLQTVIDTYPESDASELAQFYLGVIYAFKRYTHESKVWTDKSFETLENLAKLTANEKLRFQTEALLDRVKYLEHAYYKSIISMDYACETIKDLADLVKNDK